MLLQKLSMIFLALLVGGAPAQEATKLELGQSLERQLTGGQTHAYQVTLAAGEFMQVRVEQKGVDVVIILQDGNGQQLARMNSIYGKEGPEVVSWIAAKAGEHRIKIQALNDVRITGQYNINLAVKRLATAQDKRRVEVEKLFIEGEPIRYDRARLETAITNLEAALQGWQELSDRRMADLTLGEIKRLREEVSLIKSRAQIDEMIATPVFKEGQRLAGLDTLESLQAAILKFEEALRFAQGLGNKAAEANCLVTIGKTYVQMGESERATGRYNEALGIYQSLSAEADKRILEIYIGNAPLDAKKARARRQRNEKKTGLYPKLIVQLGHPSGVEYLAFSIDGKMLVSRGEAIKLWDVTSGRELRTLTGNSDEAMSVAFSPDGKTLAGGGRNKTIKLWDVANGKELRTLTGNPESDTSERISNSEKISSEVIGAVAFSPDGRILASGSWDKTIKLWDVASGKELRSISGPAERFGAKGIIRRPGFERITSITFSPDGKMLASGSWDETIRLWEVARGRELRLLTGHTSGVDSIAFSPDGKMLISGSSDQTIKLWDVASGQELRTLTGHSSGVSSVAFSPDGKMLASGSRDKTIKLWEVAGGQELRTLTGHTTAIRSVAFNSDGKMLASGGLDKTIKLWEAASGKELANFAGHTSAISRNLTRYITGIREVYSIPLNIRAPVTISPDGKILASGGSDTTIRLWNLASGQQLRVLAGHTSEVDSVAFSPDGKMLASGSRDKTIKFWEVASGQVIRTLKVVIELEIRTPTGYADGIKSVVFSPDGKLLVGLGGEKIKLWDVTSGQEIRAFTVPFESISSIAFSPDGKILAGVNKWNDGTNQLWEIATGKVVSHQTPLPEWVRNMSSVDLVTINDKSIRIDIEERSKIVLVDTSTELPLATLIALDEKDWVVVDEEGRFDGSDGALQLMHYTYGMGIIGFDQLKDEYYEPNLLQKLLGYNTEPLRAVVPLQDVKLPPDVREQTLSPDGKRLTLKLANRGGGIGKTEIFVNDKLVIPDARPASLRQNPNVPPNEVVTLTVDLPLTSYLPGKENPIRVVTSNYLPAIKRGNIQRSARGVVHLDRRKSEDTLPSVYALVSGVSDYEGDALDLRFAAKDAEDFSTALALGARRLFCPPGNLQCLDKVNITTLSTNRPKAEEQPTKENFKRALGAIAAQAKPEDIVVIYLAGHGVSLGVNTDTYFYLTKQAKSAAREDLSKNYQTVAISSEELRDWLTQTEWRAGVKGLKPLKQVLILDTCAAGTAASQLALTTKRELSGDQIRAIEFLKDKTGTFVLMGSAADAPSYEASRYGQGLLTYALLQGVKGAALDKGEFVDVQTLFSYAQKEVPRMAANIGGIQRPIISAPLGRTFVIGQMTEVEKSQVRLPSPKPLLLRPLLTNPETGDDDLKLIPALRKRFDAESSYEMMKRSGRGEPTLVYVDDDSFPEALRLTGTYTVVGDKVRVMAFLRRDGKTVATLAEIVTAKETVIEELVQAVRKALEQLRP